MAERIAQLSTWWKSYLDSHHRFSRFWNLSLDLVEEAAILAVLITLAKLIALYANSLFLNDLETLDVIHTREQWALWILLLYFFLFMFATIVKRDFRTLFDSSTTSIYVAA